MTTASEPEPEFVSHRCPTCSGPSHPATGCVYSASFIVCGPCTRQAWRWICAHINGKGRRNGPAFYDHVGAGVGAGGGAR